MPNLDLSNVVEIPLLKNIQFGDVFISESGDEFVFTGYPFHRHNDYDYLGFMKKDGMEIYLFTKDGYGPYGFSVGAGSIFNPYRVDRLCEKIVK